MSETLPLPVRRAMTATLEFWHTSRSKDHALLVRVAAGLRALHGRRVTEPSQADCPIRRPRAGGADGTSNVSIAFGWIDYDFSRAPEADRAQILRLADQLGYYVVWPCERSVLRTADQARNAGADLVILPAPDHLSPLELNAVMNVADVETVTPRFSFARWSSTQVTP